MIARLRTTPGNAVALRAERRRISKGIAGLSRTTVLALAHSLIRARVARFVAYELVLNHQPTIEAITESEVEALGEGISHWGDIDSFACIISGPAWRSGRIRDSVVHTWAKSDDWCWRRVALVSTVPLNSKARGGTGDPRRTLAICRLLAEDRHDLVVKALSWALRELAKRDPESTRRFLSAHQAKLPARVLREVRNKLVTGRKNPHHAG